MDKLTHALDIDNKKVVYDGCMVTYTGVIVDLFNPKADQIFIEDIAHGLAFTCRWNGATKTYMSVAEHCCMMFDQASPESKITALFHDAEEAYWGDVIKPLKNLLPKKIRTKMEEMRQIIFDKFHVIPINDEVEHLDFELLQWELDNTILHNKHVGMSCYEAEKEWMKRYEIAYHNGLFSQ